MDYMSDLEKFGIKAGHIEELYADNSQGKPQKAVNSVKEKEQEKEDEKAESKNKRERERQKEKEKKQEEQENPEIGDKPEGSNV